jgi:hypothetical protein
MKLDGKAMVAMVMVLGALAATGCTTASAADGGPVAPEESAATAPVDDGSATAATAGVEKDERIFRMTQPYPVLT